MPRMPRGPGVTHKTRKGPKRLKQCRCSLMVQIEGQDFQLCAPCLFLAEIYRRAAIKRFIRFCYKIGKPEIIARYGKPENH